MYGLCCSSIDPLEQCLELISINTPVAARVCQSVTGAHSHTAEPHTISVCVLHASLVCAELTYWLVSAALKLLRSSLYCSSRCSSHVSSRGAQVGASGAAAAYGKQHGRLTDQLVFVRPRKVSIQVTHSISQHYFSSESTIDNKFLNTYARAEVLTAPVNEGKALIC